MSGVTHTSSMAAKNIRPTAISSRSAASSMMCSNFAVCRSCLIIATLIIPPASAPTKNPSISKNPCIKYCVSPMLITAK